MFKKLLSFILCTMLICGLCCGCESAEEREQRLLSGVQAKFQQLINESDDEEVIMIFNMISDKEWTYYKSENYKNDNIEYVRLTGTVTYFISMPIDLKFYIGHSEEYNKDYINKIEGTIFGEYDSYEVPFSEEVVIE